MGFGDAFLLVVKVLLVTLFTTPISGYRLRAQASTIECVRLGYGLCQDFTGEPVTFEFESIRIWQA